MENCVISGFSGNGLNFARNGILFVSELTVRENNNGIFVDGSPGFRSRGTIDHALIEKNMNFGLVVNDATVAIRDSVSSNAIVGFLALAFLAGTTAELSADNCQAAHNQYGFYAGGASGTGRLMVSNSVAAANSSYGILANHDGTIRASNNSVTTNDVGIGQAGSGVLESRGNNTVRGNTTESTGTITPFTGL